MSTRRRLALSLLLFAACSAGKREEVAPGFELASGQGFTVQKPVGWSATAVSPTRFVVTSPDGSAMAAITAMPMRGDALKNFIHLEKWVKSGKVAKSDTPAKGLQRGELALVDKDNRNVTAHVVVIDGGGVSTVYWASAPAETFGRDLPTLATVLDSFRLVKDVKPAEQPRQPSIDYVQWVDPREQSFSLEVPKGWRVEGGLFRVGAIGARINVVATAPDGAVQVFMGDMSTPRFILPSEVVCSLGNCNGQPMANGDIVAQFMHATEIGAQIVQRRFGGAQPTDKRNREDIANFRKARQPTMGGTINAITAGDVDFKLADGRVGSATIANSGYQVPGLGGAWNVDDFSAFIAPRERTAEGARVLAHMIGTSRTNPQWLAAELRSQAAASEQWLAYQRDAAKLQQQVVEERWASQDKNNAAWRDALTNTVRLTDPQTGQAIELQSSDRYFFRGNDPAKDLVVGTSTDDNPAPLDMRRLLQTN